jgi:sugar phosphate permease
VRAQGWTTAARARILQIPLNRFFIYSKSNSLGARWNTMSATKETPAVASAPRFWRGWWIVGAAFVGQVFSIGPLFVYTIGSFQIPLAEAFHARRVSIVSAASVLDIVLALSAPGVGWLVDRHGARGVICAGLVALAGCAFALSRVQPPLWHLYALYGLVGLVGVASAPVTYGRVIVNWFDRKRGLALGLASAGVGLGAFITPLLTQHFVKTYGWRSAYLSLAAVALFIALPTVGLFLRGAPQDVGLRQDGLPEIASSKSDADGPAGLSVAEAVRTSTFWKLLVIIFCVAACVNGLIASLQPLLTDRGISGEAAALAASMFGLAAIVGRAASGYLIDRIFAPRVAAVVFAGAAGGVALLLSGGAGIIPGIAAGLLGLAIGTESDVMPFLVSRYFGMRSMAVLYGCVFAAYVLGNAGGRVLFSLGFAVTRSYQVSLACTLLMLLLATTATLTLGPYCARPAGDPDLPH